MPLLFWLPMIILLSGLISLRDVPTASACADRELAPASATRATHSGERER